MKAKKLIMLIIYNCIAFVALYKILTDPGCSDLYIAPIILVGIYDLWTISFHQSQQE